MFCPSCRGEFRPEITICPECDVELVAEAPAPVESSEGEYVEVFETSDSALLPVIQGLLRSAEIPFETFGDEALAVYPVGRFGAGGISEGGHGLVAKIMVTRDREAEARALLDELAETSEEET